jgi:hypothetical protein
MGECKNHCVEALRQRDEALAEVAEYRAAVPVNELLRRCFDWWGQDGVGRLVYADLCRHFGVTE